MEFEYRGLLQGAHADRRQAGRRLPERVECRLGRQSDFCDPVAGKQFRAKQRRAGGPAAGSAESLENHIETPVVPVTNH
jgi:hypothetical protein